jgi:hypothetical protein
VSSTSQRGEAGVVQDARIKLAIKDYGLEGRRLYLPQMPYGGR